ncbi:2-phospho-L-lactate guanylyltransferase [Candidatus Binatia bacterium]|jgi:2-phospho-L-lactate guanylyltransferase|nr:2-phospho-L-lactate guanylyltransferase [Candidatus Binatia bacterium]
MLWALVPAKLGPAVKTRLGAVLSPDQRLALARAMLCDVFTVLTSSPSLAGIAVVTRDDAVATLAEEIGVTTLRETHAGGLNEGVAQGIAALRARGASGVLVVMGDLPNLTAADVAQTIAALPERGVVLVPSRDGTGTNMLAARPADVLPATSFGPGSLALHRAATVSLPTVLLPLRGAALDVDTVDDLEMLLRGGAAGEATRDALADLTPPRPPERIG